MKIILTAAAGATFKGKDDKGNDVNLSQVEIQPFFTLRSGPADVCMGVSKNIKSKVLDTFALTVSGSDGTVKVRPAKEVVPAADDVSDGKDEKDGKPA